MSDRQQELTAIRGFCLVTADLPRLVRFYADVLGFALHSQSEPIGPGEMSLLGLSGVGRRQQLSLGEQTVWIEQFEPAGRSYPGGGDAASRWFQHLAVVTDDIGAAFDRLRNTTPISDGGPQLLPNSSGGVHAYKFRDPDGHPLELLQFTSGRTPASWLHRRRLDGQIGLGIDHSAITVADADVSAAFYQTLGLEVGHRTLNKGPAQQRLDGIPAVEVDVAPMQPAAGTPHLELLGYRNAPRPVSPALQPNDAAATRIMWAGREARLFADPDGHLHQVST